MLRSDTIYVKVYADRFALKNMESAEVAEIRRDPRFKSPRTLIGNFTAAEKENREGVIERSQFHDTLVPHLQCAHRHAGRCRSAGADHGPRNPGLTPQPLSRGKSGASRPY